MLRAWKAVFQAVMTHLFPLVKPFVLRAGASSRPESPPPDNTITGFTVYRLGLPAALVRQRSKQS